MFNDVSHDIGSSVSAHHTIHVSCACVFDLSTHLLLHPPDLSLHFYVDRFGAEPLCALPRIRSLAFWSSTLLSQVMSPTSSMTTTSQRPLKFSSRSPLATPDPRTYVTRRSVTTPSAGRSLRHCSLVVDKLTTLLKKVCCQVSCCLSVM